MYKILSNIFGDFDKKIFYPVITSIIIALGFIIWDNKAAQKILDGINHFLIFNFSFVFLIGVAIVVGFVLWLPFSRYGDLKLGEEHDTPEFSFFTWVSMLFCSCYGLSTLMWCAAEPLYHLYQSPWLLDTGKAGTASGVPRAMTLTWLDWGIHGWALFTVGALAIAFPAYRLKKPMTLGIGLYGILKDKAIDGPWGKLADIFGVIASLGGNAASLGFGVMAVSFGIKHIFKIDIGMAGSIAAMAIIVAGFIISAVTGIHRGIKILSWVNIALGGGLVVYFFIFGPTAYLFNLFTQTFGDYLSSFVTLSFWTDAGNIVDDEWQQRSWLNWWVIFYWLWWIAVMPYNAGFIARISRGRTIREFVLGTAMVPVFMTMVLFVAWGGTSSFLEVTGSAPIWENIQNDFGSTPYILLEQFPMGKILGIVVFFSLIFFGITTSDSASYFVAMQVAGGALNPSIPMRILWGGVLGAIALLLLATESMNALKALAIVVGAPFFFVMLAYIVSIVKMLKMVKKKEI